MAGGSNSQFLDQSNSAQAAIIPKFNFFLASLVDRKLFRPGDSLNLSKSTFNSNFIPWSDNINGEMEYTNYHSRDLGVVITPPLQALSLSINTTVAYPFKNYKEGDLTYIKQATINPFLLSLFWFNHQNVMRVEYLQGYDRQKFPGIVSGQASPNQIIPTDTETDLFVVSADPFSNINFGGEFAGDDNQNLGLNINFGGALIKT
mgnify:CR=1 FL=1